MSVTQMASARGRCRFIREWRPREICATINALANELPAFRGKVFGTMDSAVTEKA
jgi:hypothetical protein